MGAESSPATCSSRVVFWDIDGTLLATARAGVGALEYAAEQITGRSADLSRLHTAGLTDHEVAEAVLRHLRELPTPQSCAALLGLYEERLPSALECGPGQALPGAAEALAHLRDHPQVLSLLLTGNTAAGARAKLTRYGLAGLCEQGAFCQPTEDRAAIARRALALSIDLLGHEPSPDSVYVIGDTPSDVACGKGIGARTVAIASGHYSAAELADTEPWRVLDQIPSVPELDALLGLRAG